ncbi:tyrosine-type recombinase/integrase [Pseudobacteroides cellulosolvens]|uniref:Integrase family protein n=1 Tax=Pseudobacteroides cellulosolvens ATCC 35603 = DSM 2933 TaxID=398512 RepID=A0A0L6JVX6_9FIRM|nr:tyrosine-type recombinase/integrase [Pseudobacteroides cellulosolvens]KNY29874.1 integrase family protein [Pseudobacteroides cellulosolvens ATCC 35603 = DSM 2933]
MPVFFRILYTSGMRVSELRLITVGDVNLEEGYITVRNAKNHKDRIVPVHPKLIERCRMIQAEIHAVSPDDEYFFMIRPGQALLPERYNDFFQPSN